MTTSLTTFALRLSTVFGVLWDLDGTLVDTQENHYIAWRALAREHGRDLTFAQFQPSFGLRNDDVLTLHLGFSGDAPYIASLSARKEELFRASLQRDGVKLQPGAGELVAHLRSLGTLQAVASSAPPGNIELIIRLLGFQDTFAAVVSGEEVTHGKPAPDIFLRAAERLGLPPERAVVLEDAPAGVAAGKAAGSRVIAIASDFPVDSLAAADLIVHSFAEALWPAERWEQFLGTGL